MIIEINPRSPEPRKIRRAVDALRAGQIVAYPTDTCYGLGCDLFNKKAIDRLYQVKGMPKTHQLSFVCRDIASIAKYAMLHNYEYGIVKDYLPGPYCFILNATREVPRAVQTTRKQVGIRVPDHPVALALVEEHTSELQSQSKLVCRLLLEKKQDKPCGKITGIELGGGEMGRK